MLLLIVDKVYMIELGLLGRYELEFSCYGSFLLMVNLYVFGWWVCCCGGDMFDGGDCYVMIVVVVLLFGDGEYVEMC